MLRNILVLCALLLFVSCSNSNSNSMLGDGGIDLGTGTEFGIAWNLYCATYNFDTNVNVTTVTTLGDMYNGSTFALDIAAMDQKISAELGEESGLEGAGFQALYIWFDDEIELD